MNFFFWDFNNKEKKVACSLVSVCLFGSICKEKKYADNLGLMKVGGWKGVEKRYSVGF
jgi:hypothetical protein